MTINRWLAEERGLDDSTIDKIENLHILIENLIKANTGKEYSDNVFNEIEGYEYLLQECWGFTKDCDYHTWKNTYKLKNEWVGRKFECTVTGLTFVIPYELKERDFFTFGNCFVDVGRIGCYGRFGGPIKEIKEEV